MAYKYGTEEWEKAYLEMASERLEKAEKPYVMGTPEWTATYERLIQEDADYREAAKTWEGSVVIHLLANPALGLDKDSFLLMDLWHGDCRSVRIVPRTAGENGDFVLSGELERWEAVMAKELDTTKAMMQGKIKLKGNLQTIVRYVKAASRLTEISTLIGTKFLSQLDEQEREQFRALSKEMSEKFGI